MNKLAALLIALVLAVPCFAGAFVPTDAPLIANPPDKVLAPDTPMPSPPIEKIIERQIVMKEAKEIVKQYGLTAGIAGNYFTLGYSRPDLFIEAGVKDDNCDKSALIRAGGKLMAYPDKQTDLQVGLSLNPGLTGPSVGIFAGLERYLAERISLNANVSYCFGNGAYIYPAVSVGAKVVL
jgi:hypothetical protein